MVGFSLKPKDDKTAKKTGFGGFSLKKAVPKTKLPTKIKQFHRNEEEEEFKETKIDTFDSKNGGASHKDDNIEQTTKGPLVIENLGNQNWRKIAQERFNPTQRESKEDTAKALEYGINFMESENTRPKQVNHSPILQKSEIENFKEDVESRPDVATIEEYEEIPVEEFGSAMLRGMGWKGSADDEKQDRKVSNIPLVKRAPYLGLGAKSTPTGDSDRNQDKTYIPVKRVNRKTGLEVSEEQARERSPSRHQESDYRSRE